VVASKLHGKPHLGQGFQFGSVLRTEILLTVAIYQPDRPDVAECPRCQNREGIKDGAHTLRRFRKYDILTDSFGLHRCPRCGFRAGRAEFYRTPQPQLNDHR
jgi:predicted nucleic-acid-binding Zn-ribbon protein